MTKNEAIDILIEAVNVGQSKGCYSLHDASLIVSAIQELTTPEIQKEESPLEEKTEEFETPKKTKK